MKVAIVHEMLVKLGGAEKVVEVFMAMFPDAPVYTLIYDQAQVWEVFPKEKIHPQVFHLKTQKLYKYTGKQRWCLPYMASSVEALDLSDYDVVLVSSSGFAHGVITKPETKVVVYSHSPARYLWDWTHEYRASIGMVSGLKWYLYGKFLLQLRQWDYMAGQRGDLILANSSNTAARIKKYHRRESDVLYPPVETKRFSQALSAAPGPAHETWYYLIVSALTHFKRLDVAIAAFNQMKHCELKIIGSGDEQKQLESMAQQNITFLGRKQGDELVDIVQASAGLVFPGEEDFWIVPIEVMAAGKPVFALSKWGLLETVLPWKTGEFFDDPQGSDFVEKFKRFHTQVWQEKYWVEDCQKQAQRFDTQVFIDKLHAYILQ